MVLNGVDYEEGREPESDSFESSGFWEFIGSEVGVSSESTGVLGLGSRFEDTGRERLMRGSCNGVFSNSAHPPLSPISTTRSRIRESSSFLFHIESETYGLVSS